MNEWSREIQPKLPGEVAIVDGDEMFNDLPFSVPHFAIVESITCCVRCFASGFVGVLVVGTDGAWMFDSGAGRLCCGLLVEPYTNADRLATGYEKKIEDYYMFAICGFL